VRAVVITGAGRTFCAGADLSGASTFEVGKAPDLETRRASLAFPSVMPWQIRKPVIAAINGHAIGVGITFAMNCDIRLVAQEAKIQFAFVRRGITPELSSHVILTRVAGLSRAADLLLTGRTIKGSELMEMGLASKALPAEEVLPEALQLAREFHQAAPGPAVHRLRSVKCNCSDPFTYFRYDFCISHFPLRKFIYEFSESRSLAFQRDRPTSLFTPRRIKNALLCVKKIKSLKKELSTDFNIIPGSACYSQTKLYTVECVAIHHWPSTDSIIHPRPAEAGHPRRPSTSSG